MKFTVITINYNNADGLRRTIESVVNQVYSDYEYVIIDGGSTDGSVNIIREYDDKITYWVSEKDKGIYNAMNKGVKVATGEYCIFMNSGDCFYDGNVLEEISREKNSADIVTGITIGRDDNLLKFDTSQPVSFQTLYRGTISHQSSFIKTLLLRQFPYSEDLKIVADWEFWIKALILNNCSHVFSGCIVARIEPDGVSMVDSEKREYEREVVLKQLIPEKMLIDYHFMKTSECLTQKLTPQLRINYSVDRFLYRGGQLLLRLKSFADKIRHKFLK